MPDPSPDATLAEAAAASTGQLLLRAARLLDARALERITAQPGAPPIRPAHTRLFPHLDFTGVRASDLAARLGVTKQAIAPLVAELCAWGVVESAPDPSDGRARLLRFTPAGLEALLHGLGTLAALEREIAAEVGEADMAVFRRVLTAWTARLAR
jgi:DNA-binding MarR family transcriptional regulator